MLDKFFINAPRKKLRARVCSTLETIQHLFQLFFNIIKNKRDIQKKKDKVENRRTIEKFLS